MNKQPIITIIGVLVGFSLVAIMLRILFAPNFLSRVNRKINTVIRTIRPHDVYLPTPAVNPTTDFTQFVVEPTASPSAKIASPSATPTSIPLPRTYNLKNIKYFAQTWNNCGAATLTMALSFFESTKTQKEIGDFLKPNYDDKNVSPNEIVRYVENNTNLNIMYTMNGNIEVVKKLVARDIPVIIEAWYEPKPNDGMGHYYLVRGYDDNRGVLLVNDSYKGANIPLTYEKIDKDWKVFNRTFMPIYQDTEAPEVETILKEYLDHENMLVQALQVAQADIVINDKDTFAYFNMGTTLSMLGRHEEAALAFDKARSLKLPWRMLWYQFEIFDSYIAANRPEDVIILTNANLRQVSDLEESYYYRGRAYEQQGKINDAVREYEKAISYNKNFTRAQEALEQLK